MRPKMKIILMQSFTIVYRLLKTQNFRKNFSNGYNQICIDFACIVLVLFQRDFKPNSFLIVSVFRLDRRMKMDWKWIVVFKAFIVSYEYEVEYVRRIPDQWTWLIKFMMDEELSMQYKALIKWYFQLYFDTNQGLFIVNRFLWCEELFKDMNNRIIYKKFK